MITNDDLLVKRPHPLGGVQRIYSFDNGYGLSAVNSPLLHAYPFAWEITVLSKLNTLGTEFELDYTTGLTEDVEVFMSDDEANEFIRKAKGVLTNATHP